MSAAKGFTLAELLIIVSLLAILSSISVVSHEAMRPGLDLAAATRQVVMQLKVTRMRAVTDNVNHRVLFTKGRADYRVQRKDGGSYNDLRPPVALPRGIVVLDSTAGDSGISFRPRGNAGTFGTVTLANSRGDTRQVIVDIAGRIRVQ